MAQALNNASQARSVLRDAIQRGVYPPGSSLPSTRRLAEQFGINRNTANRIYHEFARDRLVDLPPNRPPVVRPDPASGTPDRLYAHVRDSLQRLLHDCRMAGLPGEDIRTLLNEVIEEYFSTFPDHRIYVAECNEEEAHWFAQELTLRLGVTVQPILLDRLDGDLGGDLILTPYFHLADVRKALDGKTGNVQGLVVSADGSDIMRVAAMVSNGPLGVVAVLPDGAERLRNLLSFQINVPMITASTDLPITVEHLQGQVECVVTTPRACDSVRALLPGVPVTMIQYQIDEGSLEMARQSLRAGALGDTGGR